MSRLIDADALIPMMRYATIDSDIGVFPIKIGFDAIVKVINAQPTIEPRKKGKWIPVSEELPKKEQWNESFLVTVQCEHVDGWDDYVVCGAEYSEYGWEYIPFPIGAIKVVAWMPITIEPYKSEDKQ